MTSSSPSSTAAAPNGSLAPPGRRERKGGTIVFGRGTGIHEKKSLLGIPIEPEKEIVLTAAPRSKVRKVLDAIIQAGELDKPGAGISFVLEIKEIAGICHLLYDK